MNHLEKIDLYLDSVKEMAKGVLSDFQEKIAKGDFSVVRWVGPEELFKNQHLVQFVDGLRVFMKNDLRPDCELIEALKKEEKNLESQLTGRMISLMGDPAQFASKNHSDELGRAQSLKQEVEILNRVIERLEIPTL